MSTYSTEKEISGAHEISPETIRRLTGLISAFCDSPAKLEAKTGSGESVQAEDFSAVENESTFFATPIKSLSITGADYSNGKYARVYLNSGMVGARINVGSNEAAEVANIVRQCKEYLTADRRYWSFLYTWDTAIGIVFLLSVYFLVFAYLKSPTNDPTGGAMLVTLGSAIIAFYARKKIFPRLTILAGAGVSLSLVSGKIRYFLFVTLFLGTLVAIAQKLLLGV